MRLKYCFHKHLVRQLTAELASVLPFLSFTPKGHNSNNQETDQHGYQDSLCDESQTFNANDVTLHELRKIMYNSISFIQAEKLEITGAFE